MKASLRGRYTNDKSTAAATLAVNAGDVKLSASMTDATVVKGPSLNGLTLAVQKPGFFIIDYDVPKKDFRFQFMNTVRVAEKPLELTYIHSRGDNRTEVGGAFVFDSANKVSANYMLGTRNFKLKYSYVHGGVTTFEPCYDWGKNAWDFAISRRVHEDVFKATYQTWNRDLALEWSRNSKFNGTFKARHVTNGPDIWRLKKNANVSWYSRLISVNNLFSWPKESVDCHMCSMVRSVCIVDKTIPYGDLREYPLQ